MKKGSSLFVVFFILIVVGFLVKDSFVYATATAWTQTDWVGGGGQVTWSDATKFLSSSNANYSISDNVKLLDTYSSWAQTYGGVGWGDVAYSVQQTVDGGYVVAGSTSFGAGSNDFWVLKLDPSGNITWEKTYGGVGSDIAYSIQQTTDGGYVVAGISNFDYWILKLDSAGAITWQKTYGGASGDTAKSIQQTADGGYIIAGETYSFGAGSNEDYWVLKLDSAGAITWQKTYGGAGTDYAKSIQQTADGGYVLAGYTDSVGAGSYDFLILKLDSAGVITWQKTYGGAFGELLFSAQQTADGGYVLAGYTNSPAGGGNYDFWVLKLDSAGAITWQKKYGGAGTDYAKSIQQTADGGYIVTGETFSFGPGGDILILKLDSAGAISWQKTYGGVGWDNYYSNSVKQTADGGYITAGYTDFYGAGGYDFWVLKLDSVGAIGSSCVISVDSTVTSTNSVIAPVDSAIASADSTATTADSVVVPANSSASTSLQCSVPNGYYSSSLLTSSTYDSGTPYVWGPLTYNATTPANTSVSFEVSIDGGSVWQAVTNYVTQTFGSSQTVAYRATLANTDGVSTPILQDVTIDGNLVPTVTSSPVTNITRTGATLNGEITATGGADATARGFQYGMTNS
ncbi:MAG: hypothetical protein WC870_01990, partial [Candidatus Paceibacterota bacterium]